MCKDMIPKDSCPEIAASESTVIEMQPVGRDETGTIEDTSARAKEKNRAAVLLLDFQNEFVKKGGQLYDDVAPVMEKVGMLENAATFLEFARKNNAMVIYSPVVMKESELNLTEHRIIEPRRRFSGRQYEDLIGLFTENTWNCEICNEFAPKHGDKILMDRSSFSAFAGTDLKLILEMNNIDHFFIMGFLTNICVYQTSREAEELFPNMSTYVISDACAAKSMEEHITSLEKIADSSVNVVLRSEAEHVLTKCTESSKHCCYDGSNDQWMLIDKFFAVADLNRDEELSIEELRSMSSSMPSINALVSILSESIGEDGKVSKELMFNILFKRKSRSGCLDWIPIIIIMYLIPFCYSVSTRLPFIFVALEIFDARQGSLAQVGWVLGVYQTSRSLGNLLIVIFGGKNPFQRLQVFQVLCGLAGWLWLAFYQTETHDNIESDPAPIWPLFGLFFVGLGETIVNLQRSIMLETGKESPSGIMDDKIIASRFSIQYSMVALGSVFAFVFGGWTYSSWGYTAVCKIGVLIQILQLVGALVYLCISKNIKTPMKNIKMSMKNSKKNFKDYDLDGNDLIRCVIYQFQASSIIANSAKDIVRGTENLGNKQVSKGLRTAARQAKNDHVLTHSLHEMYRFFFTKGRDDITAMEDLLTSVDKIGTGLASKCPNVMAIGNKKLSKLMLFLMKTDGGGSLSERDFTTFWGPHVYLSMFKSSSEASVPVVWLYMKAIIVTQAIAALSIGVFLSTALLSYNQRFGLSTARTGTLLGIGEGIGMVVILCKGINVRNTEYKGKTTGSSKQSIMRAILARPLNVPFVLFVTSTASMLFSVDNLAFAIVCQMIFSGVNDLSVSLMNELIGTSLPSEDFLFYQGIGQWLRRIGNMLTAFLGPMLFHINDAFPFVFFGMIVIIWSCALWILMYLHADKMEKINRKFTSNTNNNASDKSWFLQTPLGIPFSPFAETASTPWQALEQRYYAQNKETIEEELRSPKVDISLMETRLRSLAAALEVEKDQRHALEDRMYAKNEFRNSVCIRNSVC